MPKEKLKTKPLLFIRQPELEVNNFNMQQSYRFKVEEQEHTLKNSEAEDFKEEIAIEKSPELVETDQRNEGSQEHQAVAAILEINTEEGNQRTIREEILSRYQARKVDEIDQTEYFEKQQLAKLTEESDLDSLEEEEIEQEAELKNEEEGIGKEEAVESSNSQADQLDEFRILITRLARYPNVIERPMCEAVIDGKKIKLQVMSKRGDIVKVKIGRTIKKIALTDFEELSILPSWKGL